MTKSHGIPLHTRPPADANYDALMVRATQMSKRSGRTVAVEFAQLYDKRRRLIDDTKADPHGDFDDEDSVGELGPPRDLLSTRAQPAAPLGRL